jgi:hypothetical protein
MSSREWPTLAASCRRGARMGERAGRVRVEVFQFTSGLDLLRIAPAFGQVHSGCRYAARYETARQVPSRALCSICIPHLHAGIVSGVSA